MNIYKLYLLASVSRIALTAHASAERWLHPQRRLADVIMDLRVP